MCVRLLTEKIAAENARAQVLNYMRLHMCVARFYNCHHFNRQHRLSENKNKMKVRNTVPTIMCIVTNMCDYMVRPSIGAWNIHVCVTIFVCMCTSAYMYTCSCINMHASELFGSKYSKNQFCSFSIPSPMTTSIPGRLTTKTCESRVRIRIKTGGPTPYSTTAIEIQNSKTASVFDPSGPSVTTEQSPPDDVAANGTDTKSY